MAGIVGRFRLPWQNGVLRVQRVKITSNSRYALLSSCATFKLNLLTSSKILLYTSAAAFFLLCPLPVRIFPAKVQETLQKNKKRPESEYDGMWQKERRRLEQVDQQGENADSMRVPAELSQTHGGGLFIPITWLNKCKREYFSASDPEWQDFLALSKDMKQVKAVKTRLSEAVCRMISHEPTITRVTGKPLAVSASWLDFQFPTVAPVEYERSGILWVDNKFTWVTRRVDDQQTKRLYRVLFPTAFFSSLQALSSTLLKSHYGSLKSFWSRSGQSEHQNPADKPVVDPSCSVSSQDGARSASTLSFQKLWSASQASRSLPATPSIQADLIRNIMPEPEPNSAISAAANNFKLNFMKKWSKSQCYYPRGSCLLTGEIGIKGPKGRCKISVSVIYLPKEDVFLHIAAQVSGIWPRYQAPLRRPET